MSANQEKYTPEQIITALEKHKGLVSKAAKALRCSRQTVMNYAARYPEVREAMDDAREAMLDVAESKLFDAVRKGQPWAVCFYLKTQGKKRGYIERQEFTGADGEPLKVVITYADETRRDADG